jgi:Icc-related predicted phosphoesterase
MKLRNRARTVSRQLLFVTDLHGSTIAFRKMLSAASVYGVEALICGGDVAGKRLYPIVAEGGSRYTLDPLGAKESIDGAAALADARAQIEARGGYPVVVADDELQMLGSDGEAMERRFTEQVRNRLEEWVALADDRLAGTDVRCYVTGGNDDTDEMLEPLRSSGSERVIACEDMVVEVLGHEMISLGWSNQTPWDTPRETSEDELARMLNQAIETLSCTDTAIFNIHVPPKDSTLDSCPRLDTSVWPPAPVMRGGYPEMIGAGSSAVADAILVHQPLLSLHGHIHESTGVTKIGRTVCINPGSEYQDAALLGAIVALSPSTVVHYQLTRG